MILVLKMTKMYTEHDIDVRYKGQFHGGKRAKKFGQCPPPFRAMPERKRFFYKRCSLNHSIGEHWIQFGILEKVEQLLKRRAEAVEEARMRSEAAARLTKLES